MPDPAPFKCPFCGHTLTFHRMGDKTACGACGLWSNPDGTPHEYPADNEPARTAKPDPAEVSKTPAEGEPAGPGSQSRDRVREGSPSAEDHRAAREILGPCFSPGNCPNALGVRCTRCCDVRQVAIAFMQQRQPYEALAKAVQQTIDFTCPWGRPHDAEAGCTYHEAKAKIPSLLNAILGNPDPQCNAVTNTVTERP